MLTKIRPNIIFYFAGQSSVSLSFKKSETTYLSNVKGCENFLEVLYKKKIKSKFINASSSEIFVDIVKKLNIKSKKNQ